MLILPNSSKNQKRRKPSKFYRTNIILTPKTYNDIIKKRKLQANIFDEHRWKTPQENINKPN